MAQYNYPKVTNGFRWNLLQRCLHEIGMEPGVGDMGDDTFIVFPRELTAAEKTILDNIMANDPQNPPPTGVRVNIKDIFETFNELKATVNLPNLRIYCTEAVPGSGQVNRITLWHPAPLTNTQKNAIKTAYANLFLG